MSLTFFGAHDLSLSQNGLSIASFSSIIVFFVTFQQFIIRIEIRKSRTNRVCEQDNWVANVCILQIFSMCVLSVAALVQVTLVLRFSVDVTLCYFAGSAISYNRKIFFCPEWRLSRIRTDDR